MAQASKQSSPISKIRAAHKAQVKQVRAAQKHLSETSSWACQHINKEAPKGKKLSKQPYKKQGRFSVTKIVARPSKKVQKDPVWSAEFELFFGGKFVGRKGN